MILLICIDKFWIISYCRTVCKQAHLRTPNLNILVSLPKEGFLERLRWDVEVKHLMTGHGPLLFSASMLNLWFPQLKQFVQYLKRKLHTIPLLPPCFSRMHNIIKQLYSQYANSYRCRYEPNGCKTKIISYLRSTRYANYLSNSISLFYNLI